LKHIKINGFNTNILERGGCGALNFFNFGRGGRRGEARGGCGSPKLFQFLLIVSVLCIFKYCALCFLVKKPFNHVKYKRNDRIK
jgi:hypothetical protein